ncbi:hypothetical protein PCL_03855 [Purpureocillium lilacinum]|uniref:Uncharacterized protein n=1 Tax=Purpureocillium lilacinum TaxID=33203 RepID=A0A2U3EQ88_PURLI|nr:hypothetical protein PCL_03855 [Purpureocillium lilacinum]
MKYISAVAALLLTGASAAVSSMQGGRHAIFNGTCSMKTQACTVTTYDGFFRGSFYKAGSVWTKAEYEQMYNTTTQYPKPRTAKVTKMCDWCSEVSLVRSLNGGFDPPSPHVNSLLTLPVPSAWQRTPPASWKGPRAFQSATRCRADYMHVAIEGWACGAGAAVERGVPAVSTGARGRAERRRERVGGFPE